VNPKTKKKAPKGEPRPLTLKDYQDYCDKFKPKKRCPHPNCPENDNPWGDYPDMRECTQFKPIWISIPPGEHVHISCPVHPEGHIIYGSRIPRPRVTWDEDDFWKMNDNNLPDYSRIGKVWM